MGTVIILPEQPEQQEVEQLGDEASAAVDELVAERPVVAAASWRAAARQLPLVLGATALVSVGPAILAAVLVPPRHPLSVVLSTVVAVVLSVAATRLGAAAWSRLPGSRDVLFADLMVWAWLRRRYNERRWAAVRRTVLADDPTATSALPFASLTRMGQLLEARDTYTYGHSRRVARHAQMIARGMELPADEVESIRQAALVHDIGKIYTPREVLHKPGRLTDDEFTIIKRHPVDGADLLAHLDEPEIVAIVRHHHERLDGHGYPDGLSGTDIPIGSRIVAVADTFDALTSARSYRPAATHKKALKILTAEAGTQLDADAVAAFTKHYSARRSALLAAALTASLERLLGWVGGASVGLGSGAAAATAALALTPTPATTVADHTTPQAPARERAPPTIPKLQTAPFTKSAIGTTTTAARTKAKAKTQRTTTPTDAGGTTTGESFTGADETTTQPTTTTTTSSTAADKPGAAGAHGDTSVTATVPAADGGATTAAGTPDAGTTKPTTTPTTPTTPEVTVPPTRTPTVTTPQVSTPAVTTPQVSTPQITTPAVTTPVVTVPAVTVPSITLPSVTVGGVTVGGH